MDIEKGLCELEISLVKKKMEGALPLSPKKHSINTVYALIT